MKTNEKKFQIKTKYIKLEDFLKITYISLFDTLYYFTFLKI